MGAEPELIEFLRDRVVGGLHRGTLRGGDRLPGVRETAREMGVNARTVAKAFRELETEGLVEVRGRSGVYVARQQLRDGQMLPETMRWMAEVVVETWRRMIHIPEFPDFARRCTAAVQVRCALVESVEDAVTAYSTELGSGLGFDVYPVSLDLPQTQSSGERLTEDLRDADLIVTTSFYARAVREAAERLGKRMVMLTTHPEFEAEIRRRLEEGRLTVVAVDPRFGERIRVLYGEGADDDRIRVILADDPGAVAELDPSEPVLLTRAAHERLGEVDLTLLFPHAPSFSPESARELAEVLIRLNQEAER
jgi:DNA-binding transcriptional regulator YhcF (GntR family)